MSPNQDHQANGESLSARYWIQGDDEDVKHAVSEYRFALRDTDEGSERKVRAQLGLANALRIQFEEGLGGEEVFLESLELAESAMKVVEVHSDRYLDALMTLAEVLMRRGRSLDEDGSRRAVDACRRLVDTASDAQLPFLVKALAMHSASLSNRMGLFGDKDALNQANSIVDHALKLVDGRATFIPDLAMAITDARHRRFMVTERWNDILQATALTEEVISTLPVSHPRLHKRFNVLGFCYLAQYLHKGQRQALDASILGFSEAARRVRLYSPDWHLAHGNYATTLYLRFREGSKLEDLDEAISIMRGVVRHINDASRQGKVNYGDAYMSYLGTFLVQSYAQYGRQEFLDEAIALHLQTLKLTPPVRRGFALRGVGQSYMARFQAHGRFSDLNNAVTLFRQAVSSATVDREKALYTHLFADALFAMYEERSEGRDLEEVVSILRQNVFCTDPDIQAHSYTLLGQALLRRFTCIGDIADLNESIECLRSSVEKLSPGHIALPRAYSQLGLSEYQLAIKKRDALAAYASVEHLDYALSALSDHHPDRAAYLRSRAESELLLTDLKGEAYLEDVLKSLREASSHEESWPTDRFAAATLWARVSHERHRLEDALEGYRTAIALLPRLAWVGLEDTLRMQRLSKLAPNLAQDAAACAIGLDKYRLAAELLEAARSVLWNSGQELRADLSRLREEAPTLANELAETSAALEFRQPAPTNDDPKYRKAMSELQRIRVHRLASRWSELVKGIRSLPGFERFLGSPTYEELIGVADSGPVVIVNCSTYRSDVLIIRAGRPITLLPLSTLRYDQILQDAALLQSCLQPAKDVRGLQFLEFHLTGLLRRLWASVGERVCNAALEGSVLSSVRRLWWCPIGPMSFLPLHACGPHDGLRQDMFDLVISSYTPTLSALLRAKTPNRTAPSESPSSPRTLVICQPDVPGRSTLPCVLEELRIVKGAFGSTATTLLGSKGTIGRVEELLPAYSWLHVSTHGIQNSRDPLESFLALHDGPLTLARLAHLRLPNAEFAFLSACHSAKGPQWIPNESMHLAGGLMFAGYRSVVATMWAIADKDGPTVVKAFYEHLVKEDRSPRGVDTAEALHVAIQLLRDLGVPALRWVPFIHLGA